MFGSCWFYSFVQFIPIKPIRSTSGDCVGRPMFQRLPSCSLTLVLSESGYSVCSKILVLLDEAQNN